MSGVSVLQHFEAYQRARVTFVQAVAEAATRPQNIEVMQNAGVMQLLRPLLLDNVSFTPTAGNSASHRTSWRYHTGRSYRVCAMKKDKLGKIYSGFLKGVGVIASVR